METGLMAAASGISSLALIGSWARGEPMDAAGCCDVTIDMLLWFDLIWD